MLLPWYFMFLGYKFTSFLPNLLLVIMAKHFSFVSLDNRKLSHLVILIVDNDNDNPIISVSEVLNIS